MVIAIPPHVLLLLIPVLKKRMGGVSNADYTDAGNVQYD